MSFEIKLRPSHKWPDRYRCTMHSFTSGNAGTISKEGFTLYDRCPVTSIVVDD